jgi:uncharacterized protein (TIGR02996 family)
MSKFVTDLNSVLKYQQEQERQAFEKAIDANPLESTNHLVYADWLDEQGEPEEAAFRRSMGEWVGGENLHDRERGLHSTPNNIGNFWSIDPTDLPKGIHPVHAAQHSDYTSESTGRLLWNNYRGMESAFRKAFQAGRQNTSA